MDNGLLRIGEVAAACGVSVDTVRHYERRGLLASAWRTNANQRRFPSQAINRVQIVRRGVQFGFSLNELAAFMQARDRGTPPCRAVRGAAEALLERVEAQLIELTRRRKAMRQMLREWDLRLAATPAHVPARLLEALPAAGADRARPGLRTSQRPPRRRATFAG